MKNSQSQIGMILVAFAAIYIIWGTTYLAMRVAVETIPPFAMAGTRFILAGLATFAFLKLRGVKTPTLAQWKQSAIVGCFLMVGGNGLVSWAEQEIPSGVAALVVATMPLWMALFDWLFFKGPRPGIRIVVGLALGFVGIIMLIGPADLINGTTTLDLTSLFVLMFAPIFWSLGSLYSRKANLPENVFMATALQMLCGGAVLLCLSLGFGELNTFEWGNVSTNSLLAMLYLAVFGSIVALSAYVWLLKQTTAARVSTYTYVNPIIAVFLGWLVLGEVINTQTLIAVAIIVTAVILIVARRPKSKAAKQTTPELEATAHDHEIETEKETANQKELCVK